MRVFVPLCAGSASKGLGREFASVEFSQVFITLLLSLFCICCDSLFKDTEPLTSGTKFEAVLVFTALSVADMADRRAGIEEAIFCALLDDAAKVAVATAAFTLATRRAAAFFAALSTAAAAAAAASVTFAAVDSIDDAILFFVFDSWVAMGAFDDDNMRLLCSGAFSVVEVG